MVKPGKTKRANRFTYGDRKDLSVENIVASSPKDTFLIKKSLGGSYVVTEVAEVGAHSEAPAEIKHPDKVEENKEKTVAKEESKNAETKRSGRTERKNEQRVYRGRRKKQDR